MAKKPKKGVKKTPTPNKEISSKPKEVKPPKFVRVSTNAKQEEFKAIGDRVQLGELKWSYYVSDGGNGSHYYLVLNK